MSKKETKKIVATAPMFSGKKVTKKGAKVRIGSKVQFEDDIRVVFLTPSGKGSKYALELKSGKRYTNDGHVKDDKALTKEGRAYRAGYLKAQSDSCKAYKARLKAKSNAKKSGKSENK